MSNNNLISRVGFGCSAVGNLNRDVSEAEAQEVLHTAFQQGIRYFDSSPLYGYGLSELRMGSFIRSVGRENLTLSTKVGRTMKPVHGHDFDKGMWFAPLSAAPNLDYSYDGTLRSLEQSFLRTGVSQFDTVFIHDIDTTTHGDKFEQRLSETVEGAYRALSDLKSAGHIKEVGIGVNNSNAVERFLDYADLDVVMLAGDYTLYRQTALESLVPRLESMTAPPRIVLAGIYNSGALADPANNLRVDYGKADDKSVERINALKELAEKHGVELRDAAIQFALKPPFVDQVVIGASRASHVVSNLASLKIEIPSLFWEELDQIQ